MLVYITKNNFSKIVRRIPVMDVNLEGNLYVRFNVNLNAIFSKFEKSELLLYKMLSENPDKFLNEVYTQITEREDTYTWVYEEKKKPCYHGTPNCPRLHSDFENYQVPLPIKYKGIEKDILLDRLKISDLTEGEKNIVIANVERYRNWWKHIGEILYKSDNDIFLMRVNMEFQPNPRITDIREFKQENSGIEEFENFTLPEIEEEIDDLIIAARNYYFESEKNTSILRAYSKYTYHILVRNEFPGFAECNYSYEEIRSFLEDYNKRFKEPLKKLLRNYFRIKNNPDLKMESTILDALGFVPCGACGYNPHLDVIRMDKIEHYKEEFCDKEECDKFLNLFLDNNVLSFARAYISMYYPFTYQEIIDRWEYIIHGDAHYSALNFDFDEIVESPVWGLSFNNNIRWNSKLRARYEYGLIDEFKECIVGTHKGDIDLNEREYLDDILPLDIVREADIRNGLMLVKSYQLRTVEFEPNLMYDIDLLKKIYPFMDFEEFKKILFSTPYVILLNKSIWDNTLSKIIDLEFCDKVLGCPKPHYYYMPEELPF